MQAFMGDDNVLRALGEAMEYEQRKKLCRLWTPGKFDMNQLRAKTLKELHDTVKMDALRSSVMLRVTEMQGNTITKADIESPWSIGYKKTDRMV